MSLVNYSSSESEDEESSGNEMNYARTQNNREEKLNNKPVVLPSANLILSSKAGDVFTNKYKAAEHAAISKFEKHVKMVDTEEKTKIKNGKKICWNYRKGKCRFGIHCQFAHDSDLQVVNGNIAETSNITNNIPIASTISKLQNGLQIGKATQQQQHSVSAVSAASIPYNHHHSHHHHHHHHPHNQQQQQQQQQPQQQKDGKRNRAGLGDSLIPSKRAMKQYNANKKQLN